MASSDVESGTEPSSNAIQCEQKDILKKSTQPLGLSRSYVPNWTDTDAFREYFQNWIDGMVQSNNISQNDIWFAQEDSRTKFTATAHHPETEEKLGFISFLKFEGILEICNFKSKLTRNCLDIGVTSKQNVSNVAGTHGEGLEIASLVMIRKGYQVRIESSEFYWRFVFGGRGKEYLYCNLSPMAKSVVEKQRKDDDERISNNSPREDVCNIWEDVSIKIGKIVKGRAGTPGKKIEWPTFQTWIKVALPLNRPRTIIHTRCGDLIDDEDFAGKVYLKNLYVGKSADTRNLKFGYNFYEGEINRDRKRLMNATKQAQLIAEIWGELIRTGVVGACHKYTRMLLAEKVADVHYANDFMSKDTTLAVWEEMKKMHSKMNFFYSNNKEDAPQTILEITHQLKKKPKWVGECIWDALRKQQLVQTPEEYRNSMIHKAQPTLRLGSKFANAVVRSLRLALSTSPRTQDLNPVFKNGTGVDLDILLVDKHVLVNDKYLDFKASHKNSNCWPSQSNNQDHEAPCDHTILALHSHILNEVDRDINPAANFRLQVKVTKLLREMPQSVRVGVGPSLNSLEVQWKDMEGANVYRLYGIDLKYQVILHRESSCLARREDLCVVPEEVVRNGQTFSTCGCPCRIVSHKDASTIFTNLDRSEKYFPMVSQTNSPAFFGSPPQSVTPIEAQNIRLPDLRATIYHPYIKSERAICLVSESVMVNSVDRDAAIRKQLETQHKLDEVSQQLEMKEHRFKKITEELDAKLKSTSDDLEMMGIDLRQCKSDHAAEIKAKNNTIEDQQADINRLQDHKSKTDAEFYELINRIDSLSTDNQRLEEELGLQAKQPRLVQEHQSSDHANTVSGNRTVANSPGIQLQTTMAEADLGSMIERLQGVSSVVKFALTVRDDNLMLNMLQGVSSTIDDIISKGKEATEWPKSGSRLKHERNDDAGLGEGSDIKGAKQG